MRRCIGWAIRVVIILVAVINVNHVFAANQHVLISQIQLGDSLSASNEFIELYNNSEDDVDVTDWCLYYASGSSTTNGSKLGCFLTDNQQAHVFLPARSFAFAISTQLATNVPSLGSDLKFSATLSGTSGHVRFIDKQGLEVDKVGWGTAVSPESMTTSAPTTGMVLVRLSVNETELQDTDNNYDDFTQTSPRLSYEYGNVYEVTDLCTNIMGIQEIVPDDYIAEASGVCNLVPVDLCSNIEGIQETMPLGFELDDVGVCVPDLCVNISGLQTTLPNSYTYDDEGDCVPIPLPLIISELLPNPDGDDTGHEFIELYNPNDEDVLLDNYVFYVGTNMSVLYNFPTGAILEQHRYLALYNNEVHFTLVNTSGAIHLMSIDGIYVDSSNEYSSAPSGSSWALIDGTWQYTNQSTPGSSNQPSIIDNIEEIVTELKPCASNQYRNPETNRCRLIVTAGSTLVPCKDGQYRSEITNRCRSLAAEVATLTPCDANQYRNPETNRCKLIESSSNSLVPCTEGQERNPDTNRCKNVTTLVPNAGFAVEPIPDSDNTTIGWLAVIGVCIVAFLYGLWEWRVEMHQLFHRVRRFFHVSK